MSICFSLLHIFLLFAGVSGVTVLTQKPVFSVRKGETATMDCNLGTVTDSAARWYKQIPGGVPQFVLWFLWSHLRCCDWCGGSDRLGASGDSLGASSLEGSTRGCCHDLLRALVALR
uniref:Immunoglobulin V-set domain-containing protein n=1 Tax=Haplochromis burtoni TaxID=8153 RepID=A0A3Q2VP92_HAPBU